MNAGAVTLDVDGVRHYHAIHGLAAPTGPDPCLERGLRRFLDVCGALDLRATIFVVSADLVDGALRALVQQAARAGHEIASHSHHHHYDLSRRAPAEMDADLQRSVAELTAVTGERPRGFRAPGYNLSESLLDAVERAGFAYDSSVMPSPAYFVARAAVLGQQHLRGGSSASVVGHARAFVAPRGVYRPRIGAYFKRARSRVEGRALLEMPIATLPGGLPWLGTTLGLAPLPLGAATTAAALMGRDACILELHAIDLCDAEDGFASALVRRQRELQVPLHKKLDRLRAALRMLAQVKDVRPLGEIAADAV